LTVDLTTIRSFVSLGFSHITAPGALDHILFLLVLAAIYRWTEWRQALVVVTAFTAGHSLTLAIALLRPDLLPSPSMVEFLIPLTIVVTGIENIVTRGRRELRIHTLRRAGLAAGFGLIHGAGFAGYLSDLIPGSIGAPLLGFNVGLEIGQAVVLTVAFFALAGFDAALRVMLGGGESASFRLRVVAVSAVVAFAGSAWALQRAPW
jgi:hypothetical protein